MKKSLLIGLLSLLLIGCAGGPKAPKEEDQIAKKFESPVNGTSNLYIYRDEMYGGVINMDIYIDDQKVATTGPKTYILKNLNVGEHKIVGFAYEGVSILKINMLPNRNHYVWQEVKMGLLGARNNLQEVDEIKGMRGVLDSSLLVSKPVKIIEKENTLMNYNPSLVNQVAEVSVKKQNQDQFQKQTKRQSQKQTQKQRNYYAPCPCGTGAACYGPRGGRYCYTSGGNKRYF